MSWNLLSVRTALALMMQVSWAPGWQPVTSLKRLSHDASLEFSLHSQHLGREGKYWKLCYQPIRLPFKTILFGLWAHLCVRRLMYSVPQSRSSWNRDPSCHGSVYLWLPAAFVYPSYKWVKCFCKFWKPVSQLLNLYSWHLMLIQSPYPVEANTNYNNSMSVYELNGMGGQPADVCGKKNNWLYKKNPHISEGKSTQ